MVYGPDGFWGLEVKNTDKIRDQDLRALRAFREDYPQAKALFLYRGRERFLKNNILCLPCEEFLRQLHPDRKLTDIT